MKSILKFKIQEASPKVMNGHYYWSWIPHCYSNEPIDKLNYAKKHPPYHIGESISEREGYYTKDLQNSSQLQIKSGETFRLPELEQELGGQNLKFELVKKEFTTYEELGKEKTAQVLTFVNQIPYQSEDYEEKLAKVRDEYNKLVEEYVAKYDKLIEELGTPIASGDEELNKFFTLVDMSQTVWGKLQRLWK